MKLCELALLPNELNQMNKSTCFKWKSQAKTLSSTGIMTSCNNTLALGPAYTWHLVRNMIYAAEVKWHFINMDKQDLKYNHEPNTRALCVVGRNNVCDWQKKVR